MALQGWDHLWQLLESNEQAFLTSIKHPNNCRYINEIHKGQTLLHRAVVKGLHVAVTELISQGAKLIDNDLFIYPSPVELAALLGYNEVFEVFLQNKNIEVPSEILIELYKYIDEKPRVNRNHNKCIEMFLEKRNVNVNAKAEFTGNTSLHYAARYGSTESVLQLLRKDASLVSKNKNDELPIEDIHADTLKKHFDECIVEEDRQGEVTSRKDPNRTIIFNFVSLMPPINEKYEEIFENTHFLEVEGIFYVSKSNKTKRLLVHPLVKSLLYRKWNNVKYIVLFKILIYMFLYLSLFSYVIFVYSATSSINYFYVIPYSLLFLAEILVGASLPTIFWKYRSTWVKFILRCLAFVIWTFLLVFPSASREHKNCLSVLGILISVCNCLRVLSQHPGPGVNILIWYTVSWSYIKFMPCLIIPFIAYASAFHVLKDHVIVGIFETALSLTGDNGLLDLNTNTNLLTQAVFLAFLFSMVLVLMNTLNGIAVGETQDLRQRAEAEGLAIQVEQMFYLESLFLNKSGGIQRYIVRKLQKRYPWLKNWIFIFSRKCLFKSKIEHNQRQKDKYKTYNRQDDHEYVYLPDEIINKVMDDIIHPRNSK